MTEYLPEQIVPQSYPRLTAACNAIEAAGYIRQDKMRCWVHPFAQPARVKVNRVGTGTDDDPYKFFIVPA